jgi:hypothetical protein
VLRGVRPRHRLASESPLGQCYVVRRRLKACP